MRPRPPGSDIFLGTVGGAAGIEPSANRPFTPADDPPHGSAEVFDGSVGDPGRDGHGAHGVLEEEIGNGRACWPFADVLDWAAINFVAFSGSSIRPASPRAARPRAGIVPVLVPFGDAWMVPKRLIIIARTVELRSEYSLFGRHYSALRSSGSPRFLVSSAKRAKCLRSRGTAKSTKARTFGTESRPCGDITCTGRGGYSSPVSTISSAPSRTCSAT
jgi:hypothetical protein